MGLTISKKNGGVFRIGEITITVLETAHNHVKLDIVAPRSMDIRRDHQPPWASPPCLRAGDIPAAVKAKTAP